MVDVITLTQDLIRCRSVTPEDDGAQVVLTKVLDGLGFTCHSLPFSDDNETVENLFARLGTSGPHLCFVGHTDVVPVGDETRWRHGPFDAVIEAGKLYGRGASDMKGSNAAFAAAVATFIEKHGAPDGSISMLITGDEEERCVNGTAKVLGWMQDNNHIPDVALGGEPTNPSKLGEEIKIGRRGSLTGTLKATGKAGHVAYQALADNPLPRLAAMVSALSSYAFDQGTEFFPPSNLEFSTIDVGNNASNVIPESGQAVFNVRFNDTWSGETLATKITDILDGITDQYDIEFRYNSESFLTQPSDWTALVQSSVGDITGVQPPYTTTGGTSDARFMARHCPIVECGPVNATIHQVDENADTAVLEDLTQIYVRVLERYFGV